MLLNVLHHFQIEKPLKYKKQKLRKELNQELVFPGSYLRPKQAETGLVLEFLVKWLQVIWIPVYRPLCGHGVISGGTVL